ncbi:MAG: nitroreductase/quinone reductase family protein, partial [Microthrixaceae bacterium]
LLVLLEGDRLFIFASKAGTPTNPDWFHNISANPTVTVEFGRPTPSRPRQPSSRVPNATGSTRRRRL